MHILIESSADITYQDIKKLLHVSVGDYQKVGDCEHLCDYVSKFVGNQDIDYDFIFWVGIKSQKTWEWWLNKVTPTVFFGVILLGEWSCISIC